MGRPSSLTLRQRFARYLLSLFGWKVETDAPDIAKYVLVVYPHTSNWDFPIGYLGKMSLALKLRWVGKHTLFHWPYGWLMRALGGISVDRRSRNNVSQQLAEVYCDHDEMIIAITPEGTRSYVPHWKSGFYYIAQAANVPIALAYIDYRRKRMGIGEPFMPSGDIEADFERIRAFFADKTACYPDKAGAVELPPKEKSSEPELRRSA